MRPFPPVPMQPCLVDVHLRDTLRLHDLVLYNLSSRLPAQFSAQSDDCRSANMSMCLMRSFVSEAIDTLELVTME